MNTPKQTINFLRNYFDASELLIVAEAVERYKAIEGSRSHHEKCRKLTQIFREASVAVGGTE